MTVVQSQAHILTLFLRNNGLPVTGLDFEDVGVTLKKEGVVPEAKVLGAPDLEEVDPLLLPGIYHLHLAQADTDTLGGLLVYVFGAGFGVEFGAEVFELSVVVETLDAKIARLLGLLQENLRITDHQYDLNNNLTSATLRIFASEQDTIDMANPLATYTLTAVYDTVNRLLDYRVTKG